MPFGNWIVRVRKVQSGFKKGVLVISLPIVFIRLQVINLGNLKF